MAAHEGINFDQFKDHPYASDIDWVPTSEVAKYRDPGAIGPQWKGTQQWDSEQPYQRNLTSQIAQEGVQTPLIMNYYSHSQKAMLAEGHHRLLAAEEKGITHLPVRGVRFNTTGGVTPVSGWQGGGHIPGELPPSKFGVKTTKRGD